jgi:hypothetical protein
MLRYEMPSRANSLRTDQQNSHHSSANNTTGSSRTRASKKRSDSGSSAAGSGAGAAGGAVAEAGGGTSKRHDGGIAAPGLYALGLNFMRRRRSIYLHGAEDDVRELTAHLLRHLERTARVAATA